MPANRQGGRNISDTEYIHTCMFDYTHTYVYLDMALTTRIHFLHIGKLINMGQCILECPFYVELNVKTIFVKTEFYHMTV